MSKFNIGDTVFHESRKAFGVVHEDNGGTGVQVIPNGKKYPVNWFRRHLTLENPEPTVPDTYIAKRDQGKPQFDLLTEGCPQAQYGLVQVLTWAVEVKGYKPHSWQTVPEAIRRYTAALHRHLNAKARGERYDHESGLLHDFHILACATFIAELEARIDGSVPVFKTEMPAKSAT